MTTEIAVMNRSGIALAADSAVTISPADIQRQPAKVFNSANKLFTLSKYAPVGIMIYGTGSLMEIPWETIVKEYRKTVGQNTFEHLTEYCDDFFHFIDSLKISEDLHNRYVQENAYNVFGKIKTELEERIGPKLPLTEHDLLSILYELIDKEVAYFDKLSRNCIYSKEIRIQLESKYGLQIRDVMSDIFGRIPISNDYSIKLIQTATLATCLGPANRSGIVIAGFGESEIYPSCIAYNVAAVFEGKTIRQQKKRHAVDDNTNAAIIPFAQSDDVHTFMCGISPPVNKFFNRTFSQVVKEELPKRIVDYILHELAVDPTKEQKILTDIKNLGKGAYDYIKLELQNITTANYIQPVIGATGFLNKGELATMAETLVNLVSFRKQVTMETETVGGPIDVAIITKGDGFIWIKRKHYFDPSLNHHFFNTYFAKGNTDVKH